MLKRLFATFLVLQLVLVGFFASFHVSFSEHDFSEKPHFHLTDLDHHEHHHASFLGEHEHDHSNEIHVHLTFIETQSTKNLDIPTVSPVRLDLDSSVVTLGCKPLLPPPNTLA